MSQKPYYQKNVYDRSIDHEDGKILDVKFNQQKFVLFQLFLCLYEN